MTRPSRPHPASTPTRAGEPTEDATWLLEKARAVLDGEVAVPPATRSRAGAHLARQALEHLIDELCVHYSGAHLARAKTRSQLIVLQALGPLDCATAVRTAWEGLSQACHRHAYELPPTESEVRGHLDTVSSLLPFLP